MSFWKKLLGLRGASKAKPNNTKPAGARKAVSPQGPPLAPSGQLHSLDEPVRGGDLETVKNRSLPTFSEDQLKSLLQYIASGPIEYNKTPDLAYLLSVEEPTVLPGDYRDANPTSEPSDAGPMGYRFHSRGPGGAESSYDRVREAKGRLQNAERFACMVHGAVPSLAQADLDKLARSAKSKVVRMAAAKRLEELLRQHGGHE